MLEIGDLLQTDGRSYHILQKIGQGANTAAYLAECQQDGLIGKCILKEYAPQNHDDFERGKVRFLAAGKMQIQIRQITALNNQTPPVIHIFEANETAYIDVSCYNGTTLDRLNNLSLPQYMEICRTIAKTVGYYHQVGYLCLDLKPENIFILQNAPDDTLTQIVEFIDFDSIRSITEIDENTAFSYTREWASPEQLNPYGAAKISTQSDIYAIGEIVFWLLFGRHSAEQEHRGFSKYPFDECAHAYQKYVSRPDVQALFTRLFRGTIRSAPVNRFRDMDETVHLLGQLTEVLNQKDYIIPKLPAVSPYFVGRDAEMKAITEHLAKNRVLYLTGIGGIGKSTLIRNYIDRCKTEYDVIVYLEYDGDFKRTFCDDLQLQISTVSRLSGENIDDYFTRKLAHFLNICGEKRVLFVLDNFSGKVTKDMSHIIDCGYDTVIATRNRPPKNSFAHMEVGAIADYADQFKLIALNLEHNLTKEEKLCFEDIITLVQGHTLVIELIARQIAAGLLDIHTALDLIRENGFSRFSDEKIGNYKDGEEVYDTLSAIISALFEASAVSDTARLTLKILALLNVRGLETSLVQKFFPDIQPDTVSVLSAEGWLYHDNRIRLHPVISETVRNWEWSADDVTVMGYHQKMIDIYVGMANELQIKAIIDEADIFRKQHPRHIITAMYYNMLGWYYDVMSSLIPSTENNPDAQFFEYELMQKEIAATDTAIAEMEQSSDPRSQQYLTKYDLSLASVLIHSHTDYFNEAADLLIKISEMIEENSENHCYFCMVLADYYSLAEPDIAKVRAFTEQAEYIAKQVFPTDLEIIDIIHIPTANCFFYHNDFQAAADKLEEAVEICKLYPDMLPYIDKQAELLNCLLDVYAAQDDWPKCRALITEIDRINDTYREEGVFREVSPEIREKAGA